MVLTRNFEETVKARVERDPAFRAALLTEVIERFLAGEVDTGKALLHDFIVAAIGFGRLAADIGIPQESLQQMLGSDSDPTASSLFALLSGVQRASGIHVHAVAG